MNVFEIQEQLVEDYKSYVESFISIRDPRIREFVKNSYDNNTYWPEALVQLNPAFRPARTIDQLVDDGVLHPDCRRIFQTGGSRTMTLHQHQEDALLPAQCGRSYVLTTGTGSGKSLAYFIPIIDRILKNGAGKGLKAIVVYPMNALCNSQMDELKKFLGKDAPAVTFKRYTGQDEEEEREEIRRNPPDILLTNYMMLELILTRSEDQDLLAQADGLEFLVLDELHTYHGRQGADVAMLTRRLRERTNQALQCIGTSATMASEGTQEDRAKEVARVASTLFGATVDERDVIEETLQPLFPDGAAASTGLRDAVIAAAAGTLPDDEHAFLQNPLAAWIEEHFGARLNGNRFERVTPITISDGASDLVKDASVTAEDARTAIRAMLMRGYNISSELTGRPLFAFRLHQFISRGETVYSTLHDRRHRHLMLEGQTVSPKDGESRLYPLAFCRACGEEYFFVSVDEDQLKRRRFQDISREPTEDGQAGYLWMDSDDHATGAFAFQPERLPDRFLTLDDNGEPIPTKEVYQRIRRATVDPLGKITLSEGDVEPSNAWFIAGRLPFCLHCGQAWDPHASDFTKLGMLANEGRAGATTIISLKLVQLLRSERTLDKEAQKLLSFTDNRQDASLQAGHFNDFVMTAMLRGGILAALPDDEEGISYDALPGRVVKKLNLSDEEFLNEEYLSPDQEVPDYTINKARNVLRDIIAYRIFGDLRRSWRVNQPNLELLGLLEIKFDNLTVLAEDVDHWTVRLRDRFARLRRNHPQSEDWEWLYDPELETALTRVGNLTPEHRGGLLSLVIKHFLQAGAIGASILDEDELKSLGERAENNLSPLWRFDMVETLAVATDVRVADKQRKRGYGHGTDLTARTTTGQKIANPTYWNLPPGSRPLSTRERTLILHVLTQGLAAYGMLKTRDDRDFRIDPDILRWTRGKVQDAKHDNAFFRDFYTTVANALTDDEDGVHSIRRITAHEHTAQVPSALRAQREDDFRYGRLQVMYSSPTMELGVDISSLNAVNMRNVPPTPANYAQRSGRAGRANQPAIVVTYCGPVSPHDQYYFQRREKMVAGIVTPPRLDLANRELIEAHMHAVWLAETKVELGTSLKDVLDIVRDASTLPVKESMMRSLRNPAARERARSRCERILAMLATDLKDASWYTRDWLDDLLQGAPAAFDRACDRWRALYRAADSQRLMQQELANDPALESSSKEKANRLSQEARRQRELLVEPRTLNNDFYTYRYLASEGFLPGYNFPRLPLSAYIPGRLRQQSDKSSPKDRGPEYLQRPRFIAIEEYGPGNSIYYEGNRYRVTSVNLPTGTDGSTDILGKIRVCGTCGYAYEGNTVNADCCDQCDTLLANGGFENEHMLRLQSVTTRRVQRISSEEEERQRQGFDLLTAIRFSDRGQGPEFTRGTLQLPAPTTPDDPRPDAPPTHHAELIYAPTAHIWRINRGWRRRKNTTQEGFWIDMIRGVWSRKDDPAREAGDDEKASTTQDLQLVIPYVDDHRNALLLKLDDAARDLLGGRPDKHHYLTLGYALQRGICTVFQLDENELAMELLPNIDTPHQILFYEASEGGAGVLTRLLDDPTAMKRVSRAALELCHVDPDSGEQTNAAGDCGHACYQCLLSYGNQRYHELLNRHLVTPLLQNWLQADVRPEPKHTPRENQLTSLLRSCDSDLEREFVTWLNERGHILPDEAQKSITNSDHVHIAKPDFWYDKGSVCVFVDGDPHQRYADLRDKDERITRQLENLGYQVVRVTFPRFWPSEISQWADVFGPGVS